MSAALHGLPCLARVLAAPADLTLFAPLAAPFDAVFLELLFAAAFFAAIAALCGIHATYASGSGPRVAHKWPTSGPRTGESGPRVGHTGVQTFYPSTLS